MWSARGCRRSVGCRRSSCRPASPCPVRSRVATAVLIVNYRSYDALNRCLISLAPHLAADDEVVVVDYESDAGQLARAVDGRVGVVTLPRTDNRGFAAGVN